MIQEIADTLYSGVPDERLYHYTTISGLQGIVESRCLWASDVRYMNDSTELKYIVGLLRQHASHYEKGRDFLDQFIDWITYRITNGHMVFAASFRANGNLLSQWRGYSRIGKGISIGFQGSDIQQLAANSQFQLGRCIYRRDEQLDLIDRMLSSLLTMIQDHDYLVSELDREVLFNSIEADILRIAVLLKHPSFAEEDEWRIVSPVITDYLSAPVNFREGTSMMIPYYEFPLLLKGGELKGRVLNDNRLGETLSNQFHIPIEHVFIGPTPNSIQSLNSIRLYLHKQGIKLKNDITYCDIPYRHR